MPEVQEPSVAALPSWAPLNPLAQAQGVNAPRAHQLEDVPALADILAKPGSRTTYLAACGTGKTLTALWVAQALDSRLTIVGFPSLALISQTMKRWTETADPENPLEMLALSSSIAGDLKSNECYRPATTDVDAVEAFWAAPLKPNVRRVLFVCYRSAEKLDQLFRRKNIKRADLLICDESHHLAGEPGKEAQMLLHDGFVPADRRLMQTATAIFTPIDTDPTEEEALRLSGKKYQGRFIGMDQPEYWGDLKVQRGFRWAIDQEILTDYDLVTPPPVSPAMASKIQELEAAESTRLKRRMPEGYWGKAFLTAHEIADPRGAKRVFSFHNKVQDAKHFAAAVKVAGRVMGYPSIFGSSLSGEDSMKKRDARLNRFRQGQSGIISSVNVLNEGVDAPSVDGIAFIDQKTSITYMVQGIGRAIRTDPSRPDKRARLLVPIPAFPGTSEPEQRRRLLEGGYQVLLGVLEALGECDERIAEHARVVRLARAQRQSVPVDTQVFFDKLLTLRHTEDMTSEERTSIIDRLQEYAVTKFASTFIDHVRSCEDYARVHGDILCTVATEWQGLKIGEFLSRLRYRSKNPPKTTQALHQLETQVAVVSSIPGWTLDIDEALWRRQVLAMAAWMEQHKNRMPDMQSADQTERDLGMWAKNQRAGRQATRGVNKKRHPLPETRYNLLRQVCPYFVFSEDLEEEQKKQAHERELARAAIRIRKLPKDAPIPADLAPLAAEIQRRLQANRARKRQAQQVSSSPQAPETEEDLRRWVVRCNEVAAWAKAQKRLPTENSTVVEERDLARWLRMEGYRMIPGGNMRPMVYQQRLMLAVILNDYKPSTPGAIALKVTS